MKSATSVLLIISGLIISSCSEPKAVNWRVNRTDTITPNKELEVKLKSEKLFIDTLASDTNSLIVLVKQPGKNNLVRITDDQWPDEVETSYNILKDKNARLRYFVEIPFSESGDWFIAYKSYFDTSGRLIAFQKETNFFNSECTDETAHEVSVKYYDQQFQLLDSVYTLTDSNKKSLKRSSCFFPYDFSFKIYRTAEILRKELNINGY